MTENPQNAQNPSFGAGEVQPVPVRPGKIIAVHVAYAVSYTHLRAHET